LRIPGTGIAIEGVVNDATHKHRTKIELLQAAARRHIERPRLALRARIEACARLPVKPDTKAVLTPA